MSAEMDPTSQCALLPLLLLLVVCTDSDVARRQVVQAVSIDGHPQQEQVDADQNQLVLDVLVGELATVRLERGERKSRRADRQTYSSERSKQHRRPSCASLCSSSASARPCRLAVDWLVRLTHGVRRMLPGLNSL